MQILSPMMRFDVNHITLRRRKMERAGGLARCPSHAGVAVAGSRSSSSRAAVATRWPRAGGLLLAGRRVGFDLGFFVARVAVEGAGRGELAELVADHVLGHEDGDEL